MRVRHRIPSLFNLSMVDVLCCALGCVLLMWLLNLRDARDRAEAAGETSRQLTATQAVLDEESRKAAETAARRIQPCRGRPRPAAPSTRTPPRASRHCLRLPRCRSRRTARLRSRRALMARSWRPTNPASRRSDESALSRCQTRTTRRDRPLASRQTLRWRLRSRT